MTAKETTIRPLQGSDAKTIHSVVVAERKRLARWLPWVCEHDSLEDARRLVDSSQLQSALGNGGHWGIWSGDRFCGIVSLHWVSKEHNQAPLGYWVTEESEGRGIASAACGLLLAHGFGELGLHRVEISCAVGNVRSRKLARHLGFREEGVRRGAERLGDSYTDLVTYSLLETEWLTAPMPNPVDLGYWLRG